MSVQKNANKYSFWKINNKNVPGHANDATKIPLNETFQDFKQSTDEIWKIPDRHEKFNLIISKETNRKMLHKIPFPIKLEDSSSVKTERFKVLLQKLPNHEEICRVSWSGIPYKLRPLLWRLLCRYLPTNLEIQGCALDRKRADYWILVDTNFKCFKNFDKDSKATLHQIRIDVPRMNPNLVLFQQELVQEAFERILFIWAMRHPATGYVQGINDLLTPFYLIFLQEYVPSLENLNDVKINDVPENHRKIIEADSFWCFSKFLDGIQDNYIFQQIGIQKKILSLEKLIKRVDWNLHQHLIRHEVSYIQFAFRWLNNLLTRELPLSCIVRLWDTYLSECDCLGSFQLYVCAAFLLYWKDELMRRTEFQDLLLFLQNLPTENWNYSQISLIVAEAYKLRFIFADAPNHFQNRN